MCDTNAIQEQVNTAFCFRTDLLFLLIYVLLFVITFQIIIAIIYEWELDGGF